MYTIDVKSLINSLGGYRVVATTHAELARDHGYKPLSVNTVSGWISKNYIYRIAEVYHIADTLGIDLNVKEFVRGRK